MTFRLLIFRGEWRRKRGPNMPRALIGHCMAPLNRNEVVIAAGYSPDLDDYSDRMDIYDMEKAIWYTKPWSRLQQGDSGPENFKKVQKAKKIVK